MKKAQVEIGATYLGTAPNGKIKGCVKSWITITGKHPIQGFCAYDERAGRQLHLKTAKQLIMTQAEALAQGVVLREIESETEGCYAY